MVKRIFEKDYMLIIKRRRTYLAERVKQKDFTGLNTSLHVDGSIVYKYTVEGKKTSVVLQEMYNLLKSHI